MSKMNNINILVYLYYMSFRSCEKYWVGLCNMSVQKLNNSTRLSCNEQYNIKKSLYELRKKSYRNLDLQCTKISDRGISN